MLDCFGGSGTTAAVADKLGRRWVTGDIGKLSIYTIQKRILTLPEHQPFVVLNAGLYDNNKLLLFEENQWKQFAMGLWNVHPQAHTIKGIKFDGVKDANPVKVYTPQH